MDENAIAVIQQAERIIYRAGWRLLEEAALEGLARTRGLCWAPLEPRSELIQLVTYDGEHVGHTRRASDARLGPTWVAVAKSLGRPMCSCRSAPEAAEAPAADENQLVRTLCTTALPARLGVHWPGHACRKRIADRGPPLRPSRPRPYSYDRIGPG